MADIPISSLIFVLIPVLIALMALPWKEEEQSDVHQAVLGLGASWHIIICAIHNLSSSQWSEKVPSHTARRPSLALVSSTQQTARARANA